MARPRVPSIERFIAKVDMSAGADGCWNWMMSVGSDGYGLIRNDEQLMIRAHRYAYRLRFGAIPDGSFVLHRCVGNRRCVNPDHLYLGDHAQNMLDKVLQGRSGVKSVCVHGHARYPGIPKCPCCSRIRSLRLWSQFKHGDDAIRALISSLCAGV